MIKPILGATLGIQSVALFSQSMKLMKNPTPKNMLKAGVTTMIGIPILSAQANLIKGL